MSAPAVSVVCTARDAARTLGPVLDSIAAQTEPDWECLVVDDGSRDETPDLVNRWAKEDHRFRLLTPGRIGRGTALNLAVREARAPLVANVDADDPSHPRRLELQRRAFARGGWAVLGTGLLVLKGDAAPSWPALSSAIPPPREVTAKLAHHNPVSHSSVLMDKAALESVGGYDERRRSQFDYDLWVRLAASGRRLASLDLPLASKRLHAGQSFETRKRVRYVLGNAACQARAIRALGAGPGAWVVLAGRVGWGLLPAGIRGRLHGPLSSRFVPRR